MQQYKIVVKQKKGLEKFKWMKDCNQHKSKTIKMNFVTIS